MLEGGAFRGVYSSGVLDALMESGVNLECTVGVSAGAINGLNYVSGQIGRSIRVNLTYRHDSRYVGMGAMRKNQGIIGFDFLFQTLEETDPFDSRRFFAENRRFVAVAANCITGNAAYLEKGKCADIFQAVRASASMPFFSKPVWVEGMPYLDGGCADSIPYRWAMNQGYKKILVVRTRPAAFRKKPNIKVADIVGHLLYLEYPTFSAVLGGRVSHYNRQCDEVERLAQKGRVLMIAPSKDLRVSRLEPDLEKLKALYALGYEDTQAQMNEIKRYLGIDPPTNICTSEV